MNIELTFTEPEKGKLPISKDGNGKIHLLDWGWWKSHKVKPGETWDCNIHQNESKKCVVRPITMVRTVSENDKSMEDKIQKLKDKHNGNNAN